MYHKGESTFSIAAVTLMCLLFVGVTCGQIPHMDGIDEKVVHVAQTLTSRVRGRRSVDAFPPELRLDIIGMADVVLHRKYEVTDDVPILLKRNSRVEQFRPITKRSVAFYTNTTIEATFMTWKRQDSSELDVFGTFVDHEEEYLLQTDSTASTLARVPRLLAEQLDTMIVAPSTLPSENFEENNTADQPSRIKRETTEYEVEVMVVVDFALYSFWVAKMSGSDVKKKADAMETIRQYYAFILNGINMRYATVTGVSYTITALYAGIYIADTADAAPFDEPFTFDVAGLERKAINAYMVLPAFMEWAAGNLSSYSYDHAMMFTAYKMASNESGTFSTSLFGLVYVFGACSDYRYSINEDHFDSFVNIVASHELAHNLGANHDGENGNACQPADNYVMAARPNSSAAADNTQNLWRFSNCTISSFTKFIDFLNTYRDNCLSNRSGTYDSSLAVQYSDDIAGQVYPPDTQCQYIVGDDSFLMTSVYAGDYSSICTKLYCYVPGTTGSYYSHIAWEGTTCGNGKICSSGKCVASANAPTGLDDTCLFGDMPYNIPHLNITCQEMINEPDQTYICYNALYNNYCCASCKELETRYTNVTGTRIITVSFVLRITLSLEINLTDNRSMGYLQIKSELELQLRKVYSKRLGFVKVILRKLRRGSLEVDYEVETEATQQASTNFVKATTDILSAQVPFTIQNETVSPDSVNVNNIKVTIEALSNADQFCALFVAISGGCPDSYSCVVVNGEAVCEMTKMSDMPAVGVWIGTGVSVFLIFVIVPAAVIICRRKRKTARNGKTNSGMLGRNSGHSYRHSSDCIGSEFTGIALYETLNWRNKALTRPESQAENPYTTLPSINPSVA